MHYFGVSKRTARGMTALATITLLTMLVPVFLRFLGPKANSSEQDRLILDSLVAELQTLFQPPPGKPDLELFPFNPNIVGESELLALGIDEPIARRIVAYRNAGGRFYVKKDLLKIYGLTEAEYARLQPFIDLPEKHPQKTAYTDIRKPVVKKEADYAPPPKDSIDINLADSADLMPIYGIGPKLSARIAKFRYALGGYVSEDQLSEVYGLNEETLKRLQAAVYVDPAFVPKKINMNFANAQELARHAYISRQLAENIVAFRDEYGPFKGEDDPALHKIIPDTLLNKLKPYILF